MNASLTAFDLHDPAVPVAPISFDSVLDGSPECLPYRRLVFETPELSVELHVGVGSSGRDLEIEFSPPCQSSIDVVQVDGRFVVKTTDPGCALVEGFRSGLTSLLVRRDPVDGGLFRTAWVIL